MACFQLSCLLNIANRDAKDEYFSLMSFKFYCFYAHLSSRIGKREQMWFGLSKIKDH